MKKKIILVVLLLLVCVPILNSWEWIIGGYDYKKEIMKLAVVNYITTKHSISSDKISSIKVDYLRKFGYYLVQVNYSDDDEMYLYRYKDGIVYFVSGEGKYEEY